jgi:hypothetical protein
LHPELKKGKGNGDKDKSINATAIVEQTPVPPDIATSSNTTLNMLGNGTSILFYYDLCNDWMIDSSASNHISKHPADFVPGSV